MKSEEEIQNELDAAIEAAESGEGRTRYYKGYRNALKWVVGEWEE